MAILRRKDGQSAVSENLLKLESLLDASGEQLQPPAGTSYMVLTSQGSLVQRK